VDWLFRWSAPRLFRWSAPTLLVDASRPPEKVGVARVAINPFQLVNPLQVDSGASVISAVRVLDQPCNENFHISPNFLVIPEMSKHRNGDFDTVHFNQTSIQSFTRPIRLSIIE
jgi:hypothetical protein